MRLVPLTLRVRIGFGPLRVLICRVILFGGHLSILLHLLRLAHARLVRHCVYLRPIYLSEALGRLLLLLFFLFLFIGLFLLLITLLLHFLYFLFLFFLFLISIVCHVLCRRTGDVFVKDVRRFVHYVLHFLRVL